ncbi:MAG: histidine phosphatase family protein [Tepidibacter sp.]|jgi:probable phosphoglycerate mutase|uniref:histidine phosphatase family protein n=1 Tax=Tepidibacter sp. TaxID=2529387 RepID=UPI0025D80F45|nr:histidine phosphatase family protein [Tepidibacter sp.]MCT4507589.1 histidine phosphatase family protein [Tepidibacter sp.]
MPNRKASNKRLIYLIRHGQTELSGEKRYVGHTDCSLSGEGIETMKRLKSTFLNTSINHVFCSDLSRTKQSADILFKNKKIHYMRELREINMGIWEGLTFKDVKTMYPKMFEKRIDNIGDFIVPDGESFRECQIRAVLAIKDIISKTTGNLAILGHAGFFRALITHILDIDIKHIFNIKQDYGCINILIADDTLKLKGVNLKKIVESR